MKARANILGTARGSRAGEAGAVSWTSRSAPLGAREDVMESLLRRAAKTSTRDACATLLYHPDFGAAILRHEQRLDSIQNAPRGLALSGARHQD